MPEIKRMIRHAILNLLTVIGMTFTEPRISKKEKERADDFIKLIALLLSHENILLGEKPKFIIREMNLADTLDLIECIYEKNIVERKVVVSLPKRRCLVQADSHYVKEALQQIFRKILYIANKIDFHFDQKTKELTIKWVSDGSVEIKQKKLVECLDEPSQDNGREIAFQFALELLHLHKIPFSLSKSKISIAFK